MKKGRKIAALLCAGLLLASCGESVPAVSEPPSAAAADSSAGTEPESIPQERLIELEWQSGEPLFAGKLAAQQLHGDSFYMQVAKMSEGSTLYQFDLDSGAIRHRLETPANCGFQIVGNQIYLLERDRLRAYDDAFTPVSEQVVDSSAWKDARIFPSLSMDAQEIFFANAAGLPVVYTIGTGRTALLLPEGSGLKGPFSVCREIAPHLIFLVETADTGISYLLFDRETGTVTSVDGDYPTEREGLPWDVDVQSLLDTNGVLLADGKDIDILKVVSNRAVLLSYFDTSRLEHLALYLIEK